LTKKSHIQFSFWGIVKTVFFLALGIGLVYYSLGQLSDQQKKDILLSFVEADYFWIGVTFIAGILSHLMRSLRWSLLIRSLGFAPREKITLASLMVGYLANLAVPRLGEVTRCAVLSKKEKIPVEGLLGSVLAERLFDTLMLGLICFLTYVSERKYLNELFEEKILSPLTIGLQKPATLLVFGLVVVLVFIIIIIRKKKHQETEKKNKIIALFLTFADGLQSIFRLKQKGYFLLYTLLMWFLYASTNYFAFLAFGHRMPADWGMAFSVLVFGSFAMILVQGGIGAFPLFVMLALETYNIDKATGLAYGWIVWTGQFLIILVMGLISLLILQQKENGTKQ
jgi:glycosyltransferase 2 family protein